VASLRLSDSKRMKLRAEKNQHCFIPAVKPGDLLVVSSRSNGSIRYEHDSRRSRNVNAANNQLYRRLQKQNRRRIISHVSNVSYEINP
jgi:hypothetical protein